MRKALKDFRLEQLLTREEIAAKIEVAGATYGRIEKGCKNGSVKFWRGLKHAFNLTNEELKALMIDTPTETESEE